MGRPIRFGGERKGVEERSRYMIDIAESALATVEKPARKASSAISPASRSAP